MARQRSSGSRHANNETMATRCVRAEPANRDIIPTRGCAGLFDTRPRLYIALILCAILGTYGYKVRTEGIFSCQATGYAPDWYLAYCHADGYGDYEHGAFGFDLEPAATQFAAGATVLFLGSSRMQHALSTKTTADWFSSAATPYYLMGFGYTENVVFVREILRKLRPSAKVYVINVDGFFVLSETPPAKIVLRDSNARIRYAVKRAWQSLHQRICHSFAAICGDNYVIFRSRKTGDYRVWGLDKFKSRAVSYDRTVNRAETDLEIATAREFLRDLPVNSPCVILTMVPMAGTKIDKAKAIAAALDMDLVAPDLEGLRTFDGSHLDRASAERWSQAFLQAAAPRIRQCTGDARLTGTAAVSTPTGQ